MGSHIANALLNGYPARVILNQVMRQYPQHAGKIQAAQAAGYSADMILKNVSQKDNSYPEDTDDYLTEHEQVQKRDTKQKKKAALQALGVLGTAGAVAAGAIGYATRNQAVRGQILPPLPQNQTQRQLPGRQQLALPNLPPQRPSPRNPPSSPGNPPTPQNRPPSPQPQPGGQTLTPNTPTTPTFERSVQLVNNLKVDTNFQTILKNNLDPYTTAQMLRQVIPRGKIQVLDKIEGGLEQVVKDYKQFIENNPPAVNPAFQGLQEGQRQEYPPELIQNPSQMNPDQIQQTLQNEPAPDIQEQFQEMAQQEEAIAQEEISPEPMMDNLVEKSINPQAIPEQPQEMFTPKNRNQEILKSQKEKKENNEKNRKKQSLGWKIQDKIDKFINMDLPKNKPEVNKIINEGLEKGLTLEEIQTEIMRNIFEWQGIPETEEQKEYYNYLFTQIFGPSKKIKTLEKEKKPEIKIEKIQSQPEPITIGNLAVMPKGDIGEVESVKNGIAKININGKIQDKKLSEIKQEPKGIEDAVRDIVNSIPEGMKSTALQTMVHVPLEGLNLLLTQFYDGKWAWYKDVPENVYHSIALGTYEPKGEATTGIGKYKPGVLDSRGAGFHTEIKMNPKYSKENKGITWGYATSEYGVMHSIQNILHKISKEKYDSEGNIQVPKKRKKP
jgi:hypothetical protein